MLSNEDMLPLHKHIIRCIFLAKKIVPLAFEDVLLNHDIQINMIK